MRLRLLATLLALPVLTLGALLRVRSGVRWGKAALEVAFGMYTVLVGTMVFPPVFLDPAQRALEAHAAARFGMGWFNPVTFRTVVALVKRATATQLTLAIGNLGLLLPL
jgi:hypothetical protein